MVHERTGESLIELLVALVVLEVAGAAALATAFTIERIDRRATESAAVDSQRTAAYRAAELQPRCVGAPAPDTLPLFFPAAPQRPALVALVRCGP